MKLSIFYKLAKQEIDFTPDIKPTEVEGKIPEGRKAVIKKDLKPINTPLDIPETNMGPKTNIDMANVEGAGMIDSNVIGGPIESAW